MLAGGGAWHKSTIRATAQSAGFQLWLALPPQAEDGPSDTRYIPPDQVARAGNTRVLIGSFDGVSSPIRTPTDVNCFDVSLAPSEEWTFMPAIDHEIAWVFVYRGELNSDCVTLSDELVVFDRTDGAIAFEAKTNAGALVGTGAKHDYPLIIGWNSIHTNMESLIRGQRGIQQISERRQS